MSDRFSHTQAFLIVSSVVFVSRLPFINTTLGTDADVYRVALTALHIAREGEYLFSRFPGFPVQEYVFAFLIGMPAVVLNLITALLSAIGAGVFTLFLRRLHCDNGILLGFALACTPIVFVHSTTSLDYVWALTCIVSAVWFVLKRPWLAGVLIGLAVGIRFTSLLMLAPMCFLLWKSFPSSRLRSSLQFIGMVFLTTCVLYTPVILSYQPDPTPHIPMQTDMLTSLYKASVGVWGVPGLVALAGMGITLIFSRLRKRESVGPPDVNQRKEMLLFSGIAIVIYVAIFAQYPYESGYLIPIIPWVLLILGMYMNRVQTVVLTATLLLSSFTFGIISTDRPELFAPSRIHVVVPTGQKALTLDVLKGPVWIQYEQRESVHRLVKYLVAYADTVSVSTVIVVGWVLPQLRFELQGATSRSNTTFAYALKTNAIEYYRDHGYDIRYLKSMNEMNIRRYGVDLAKSGASEMPIAQDETE